MIQEIEKMAMPGWLRVADALTINIKPFPLNEVLTDSLFYPASAFDGDPVRFLAGNFYSFIYVDYGLSRHDLNVDLTEHGCRGYDVLVRRELSEKELAPNGWVPDIPLPKDGQPEKRKDRIKRAFAEWVIFERKPDFPDEHGPERFSLVYLCADGVAAFKALYVSNGIAPKAVAIIQPGTGFGGNWTDFRNSELILGRSVLGNNAGIPEYLVCAEGDRSPKPFWSEYSELVKMIWTGRRQIGVWRNVKGENNE